MVWSLIFISSAVFAQKSVDETRKVSSKAEISISNISGSVTVAGWSKNEIHITGELGEKVERLDIKGDEDQLDIEVVIPRHANRVGDTFLEIHLPENCRVNISTVSADIDVDKVSGKLFLESVSGDFDVRGKPELLDLESVSGDMDLQVETHRINISSVSSDIELKNIDGELDCETVSGDIRIEGGEFTDVGIESVSGDINFNGDLNNRCSCDLNSHSGDITLALSKSASADFEVSTFSGSIENDFGANGRRTSDYTPGRELHFTMGSGDATVRIETFSGDIVIGER